MNQSFLGVFVNDPAAFIAQHSMLKQKALQANLALGGTPIAISGTGLPISLNELEDVIRARWRAASIELAALSD
jgi:hypothetical protein